MRLTITIPLCLEPKVFYVLYQFGDFLSPLLYEVSLTNSLPSPSFLFRFLILFGLFSKCLIFSIGEKKCHIGTTLI